MISIIMVAITTNKRFTSSTIILVATALLSRELYKLSQWFGGRFHIWYIWGIFYECVLIQQKAGLSIIAQRLDKLGERCKAMPASWKALLS